MKILKLNLKHRGQKKKKEAHLQEKRQKTNLEQGEIPREKNKTAAGSRAHWIPPPCSPQLVPSAFYHQILVSIQAASFKLFSSWMEPFLCVASDGASVLEAFPEVWFQLFRSQVPLMPTINQTCTSLSPIESQTVCLRLSGRTRCNDKAELWLPPKCVIMPSTVHSTEQQV